jgi:DnaJ-class molecular chaperone
MRLDEFNFTDKDECTRCMGLKHHPSDPSKECPECHGTGKCPHADEKVEEAYKKEDYEGESKCSNCGGEMDWCYTCDQWTSTCCVEYGTCMCS